MIQLVAFLGNPGAEYAQTRHNVAWLLAEHLPFYRDLSWQRKHQGRLCMVDRFIVQTSGSPHPSGTPFFGQRPEHLPRLYFLLPETYMNLSGKAIREVVDFYRIPYHSLLVVHDELELPFGSLSLKCGGGLGGHNGLRSCRAELGTAEFWRLRIGIGRPEHPDIAAYVLSRFSPPEQEALATILAQGAQLLQDILIGGPEKFLPEWNKKQVFPSS